MNQYVTLPAPGTIWTATRSEGSTLVSSRVEREQFHGLAPPEGVHWIGRNSGIFSDPSGSNDFAHSLTLAGIDFRPGATCLDFGCSSGRTVRTFAAAYPDVQWHGCDPIEASIEWASKAMPHIQFRLTPQQPPTEYVDATFDGIYAISVWSHFSKESGLAWLREMHRLLKPNGWLAFSTHGTASIAHRMRRSPENAPHLTRLWQRMLQEGFVFIPAYKKDGRKDLNTDHWGLTYMTAEWVAASMAPRWALLAYDPARYGGHQDIYVLQRR